MNLRIKVINKTVPIEPDEVESAEGRITIGDHWETFYMPLDYWAIEDYERQWKEGLERLKTHNKSCLIVSIRHPHCQFIEWWPIYKIENKIYIQNHIIVDQIYKKKIGTKDFTHQTCYDFIPSRGRKKVSEWVVDYS